MSEFYRQKVADGVEFIFGSDFGLNGGDWTSQFVWTQKPPKETWVNVNQDRSEKGRKRLQQLREQAEDIGYEEVHC